MSYVGVYVINRIHAAGQAAVVRPFIRMFVLRGKNLNVGQNTKTSFSTETSESSGHFTKERVNEEIFTGFVYLGRGWGKGGGGGGGGGVVVFTLT